MRKILILCLVSLYASASLYAQIPRSIQLSTQSSPSHTTTGAPEIACNAGTFHFGTHTGQSNDFNGEPIYLCLGDSMHVIGDGNATFMDPQPGTSPGIGYAFYKCKPTLTGTDLAQILTEPCIWDNPTAANGIWVSTGTANGNETFYNNGFFHSWGTNPGSPVQIWYAPITLDDFDNQTFEQTGLGQPLGPCVNVNAGDAFSIVYLTPVTIDGISSNSGNDCIGKIRVKGGFPEFDLTKTYTIDIALSTNSNIKAIIHTPPAQWKHSTNVLFSVPQSGVYNIVISDGKSCLANATVNMSTCNPTDNIIFDIADISGTPGSTVCVPITTQNFTNMDGFGFNIKWNPSKLQYQNVQNGNPAWTSFNPLNDVNAFSSTQGYLGFVTFLNPPVTINSGGTLLEVCFTILEPLGVCDTIKSSNSPSSTSAESNGGIPNAITINSGTVCAQFTAFEVVLTPQNACNTNGSFTISATGGTAPYDVTYIGPTGASSGTTTLQNSGSSSMITDRPAGVYTVYTIDANGIIDTSTTTIVVNTLGATLDFTLSDCSGTCSGTAIAKIIYNSFTLPNPGAAFSYNWSPAAANTQTISNLCVGSYSVTVTNNLEGCTAVASGTLSQPPSVAINTIDIVKSSCTGVSNGTITLDAIGGQPLAGGDYQFQWSYSTTMAGTKIPLPALSSTSNPANVGSLAAGFYHVVISDANGCTFTDIIEVENEKILAFDPVTLVNAKCFGAQDGSINLELSTTPAQANTVSTWDYTPKPPSSSAIPGSIAYSVMGLPFGTYIISATDSDGCKVKDTFDITQPLAIVVLPDNLVNPSCLGINDGSIAIRPPSGGQPPFTYLWSTGATTQNISTLTQGTYMVTVSDQNGCTSSLSSTITLPTPPVVTGVDSTSVKCGADGILKVKSTTAGVIYAWQNITTGTNLPSTAQITGLMGGLYAYSVTDANGCQTLDTFYLKGVNGMFLADTNFQKPSCFGLSDGFLGITVQGGTPGTPAYTYNWTPVVTPTSAIANIAAGIYTVTVKDGNNCTLVGTFTLGSPPDISLSFSGIKATSCSNSCDGEGIILASYASTPPSFGNFSFGWEDKPNLDDSTRTDLCAGFMTIIARDANNCFKSDSFFVDSPSPVVADTSYTIPTKCNGESNGSAVVSGGGGNGPQYSYDWGAAHPLAATITDLPAGQYTVTITDNIGCTGTKTLVVQEPNPIMATLNTLVSNDIICNGGSNGQIGVNVTGGNGSIYSYIWTDGSDTIGNTIIIDNLKTGRYSVTVSDVRGCTGTAGPFSVLQPDPIIGGYLPWDVLVCFGDQTTLHVDSMLVSGGSGGPYQFSVDYGVALDVDFPISVGGGSHIISYFDRLGCSSEDSIFIEEPEQILVSFDPNSVEIELGDTLFQLKPIITGANIQSFSWTNTFDLTDSTILRPYAGNFETQTFTLTVLDANGCSGAGSIVVNIDPNRNVYIPNIFKPGNSSGLNDHFNPLIGNGVAKVNFMRIHDRWGALVYERNNFLPNNDDYSEGWNGVFRGKKVEPGVFVYLIEVAFLDGRVLLYRGDVTVVR